EVLEQLPLRGTVQRGVEGGDPQVHDVRARAGRLGGGLGGGGQAEPRGGGRGERSTTGHAWSHAPIVHAGGHGRYRGVDDDLAERSRSAARWQTGDMRIAFLGTGSTGTERGAAGPGARAGGALGGSGAAARR